MAKAAKTPTARTGHTRPAHTPSAPASVAEAVVPPAPGLAIVATNPLAVDAVRDYAARAKFAGCSPDYVDATLAVADEMAAWQAAHPEMVGPLPK